MKTPEKILVKSVVSCIQDLRIIEYLLLACTDGLKEIHRSSMFCVGEDNKIWQEDLDKLKKTHALAGYDPDGWQTWLPKPVDQNGRVV